MKSMMSYGFAGLLASLASMIFAGEALAQSGHFVGDPVCRDIGTQVECTGKIAGLGGTTFQIIIEAEGVASVECTNQGGNVAPGQSKEVTTLGETGPQPTPRNGSVRFALPTADPTAPPGSCPNTSWTATVVDVEFTTATIDVFENGTLSDTVTVPVA